MACAVHAPFTRTCLYTILKYIEDVLCGRLKILSWYILVPRSASGAVVVAYARGGIIAQGQWFWRVHRRRRVRFMVASPARSQFVLCCGMCVVVVWCVCVCV